MKMPPAHITIDEIAQKVGTDKPVEVIDCAYVVFFNGLNLLTSDKHSTSFQIPLDSGRVGVTLL